MKQRGQVHARLWVQSQRGEEVRKCGRKREGKGRRDRGAEGGRGGGEEGREKERGRNMGERREERKRTINDLIKIMWESSQQGKNVLLNTA